MTSLPNTDNFRRNERVFIQGLIKANHLNKLIGTVKGKLQNSSRLAVMVNHLNRIISIRPANISHATAENEIESILRHLATDEKCALMPRFSGPFLPPIAIDYAGYLRTISSDPNGFCGCTSIYSVIKYLLVKLLGFDLMDAEQKIEDYDCSYDLDDGKEIVLHKLWSFMKQRLEPNKISVCLLELHIYGFERKFSCETHQISILRVGDSFRIIQSWERMFSLEQELNARDWINMKEMKNVIECILDVTYGKDADSAMQSFQFLFRFKLNVVEKKFKRRDKINNYKIAIYTNEANISDFIRDGNKLLQEMYEWVDRINQ